MARRASKGQQSFSAAVANWVRKNEAAMEFVFKSSAQRVFSAAQFDHTPIDTGFLRASFVANIGSPTAVSNRKRVKPKGHTRGNEIYSVEGAQIAMVIDGAQLGQTIYGNWTANYAIHVEYGTSRMRAHGMTRLAAQQWKRIVREQVAEAKRIVG